MFPAASVIHLLPVHFTRSLIFAAIFYLLFRPFVLCLHCAVCVQFAQLKLGRNTALIFTYYLLFY
jgi:hypothetical protein